MAAPKTAQQRTQEAPGVTLYEYPFNERLRTYLRLEHLLLRLTTLIARSDAIDHHNALACLFELQEVATRADLKADVLKDLEKHKQQLDTLRGNPAIAESALLRIIDQLEQCRSRLIAQTGKPGQNILENEWLSGIRSRMGIPGGTCGFDLPSYHAWLHHSPSERQQDLHQWTESLLPLAESVHTLLRLIRDSGMAQRVVAERGQFQLNLAQGRVYQLLRLRIHPGLGLIPEISGNRLRVSVRFMQQDTGGRLQASQEDANFELTLCS